MYSISLHFFLLQLKIYLLMCLVTQSCLTLWGPMDCSPRGSSIHSIFQARILEWVAIFYSRGSSRPRDRTNVSSSTALAGRFFTTRPPGQPLVTMNGEFILFGESWSPLEPFAFRALEIPSRSYRHYVDLQVPLLLPGELRTPLPCKRHPQSEGAGL